MPYRRGGEGDPEKTKNIFDACHMGNLFYLHIWLDAFLHQKSKWEAAI